MTIKDIAKLSGTSIATVSRVINNDSRVGKDLKQRVLAVIKATNYIPNTMGRNLRKSKSEMILVMLPTLSNPFYSKILKGIEERASELGYGVFLTVTHLQWKIEKKYLEMVKTKQVDGVISLFTKLSIDEIDELASKYPFVQCCEYTEGAKLPYVMIDNQKAAYAAVNYFISHGHKKIGMISGSFYENSEKSRENGYKTALLDAGLPFDENYIIKSNYKPENGMEICKKLLNYPQPPTAILTVSDSLAIGAIKYLKTANINVGGNIEIIGFDNASITKVYDPSISSVSQPRYALGKVSVDLLVEKINDLSVVNKGVILPYELILRESTRRNP